ncbi:MAG: DUF2835 domain-containing protein [Gammaproteobacteria bacterium]|nr:DUF2835 domain-containing protein [Gammaproteobacteria bacterium]
MTRRFEFNINLSADKTHRIYQGQARYILVYTDNGTSLQLPAINFQRYVTEQGIQGRFEVEIDDRNKIIRLAAI